VLQEVPRDYPLPGPRPQDVPDHQVDAGRQVLAEAEKLARDLHPDLTVTTRLERGLPRVVLLEQAKEAFTMVLGNRGHGGFASLLLGSTGLRVAGHAQGPVVIVRGTPDPVHGEIVAGVDLYGRDNDELLAYAFDEASLRGARLRVRYAFQLAELLLAAGDRDEASRLEQGLRAQLQEIVDRWQERYQSVHVVQEVVREHPVQALVDASRRADLLVVGARGHSPLGGVLLGSVSHGVIHHAACPVAVVGPRR